MTKKDYELIASDIACCVDVYRLHRDECARDAGFAGTTSVLASVYGAKIEALNDLACTLANTFADRNPKFDNDKFIRACGF